MTKGPGTVCVSTNDGDWTVDSGRVTALAVSFRQRLIAPSLRGRIASVFLLASLGFQGIGILLGGSLAGTVDVPLPIIAGGVLACLLVLAPGSLWRADPAADTAIEPAPSP